MSPREVLLSSFRQIAALGTQRIHGSKSLFGIWHPKTKNSWSSVALSSEFFVFEENLVSALSDSVGEA
jgi:hypothetical protein